MFGYIREGNDSLDCGKKKDEIRLGSIGNIWLYAYARLG